MPTMSNKLGNKTRRSKRGRSSGGPNFIQLFRYVLDSPAYISLSSTARAVLIEVNHAYNGSNNGRIILSERKLAERLGCERKPVRHALRMLIDRGFIEPRVKGAFSVKFRRATEWRLNDRRCDVTGVEQSQAFLRWQNPDPDGQLKSKTRGSKRPTYGVKKTPLRTLGRCRNGGQKDPTMSKSTGVKKTPLLYVPVLLRL